MLGKCSHTELHPQPKILLYPSFKIKVIFKIVNGTWSWQILVVAMQRFHFVIAGFQGTSRDPVCYELTGKREGNVEEHGEQLLKQSLQR